MQIESIRYFLALKEHGSFSVAAMEACISQSSLSKHIKGLENELGVALFNRTTRTVTLTDAGESFAAHAAKIISEHENMLASMRGFMQDAKKRLHIVSTPVLHLYGMWGMIDSFRKSHPDVLLHISEHQMLTVARELTRKNADLGIVRTNIFPQNDDYTLYPLLDEELVLICSPEHRLTKRTEVSLADLKGEYFALLRAGVDEYEVGLRNLGFHFDFEKAGILCQNPEAITRFVSQNTAVSIMMLEMAKTVVKGTDIRIVHLAERPSFPLAVAARVESRKQICTDFIEFANRYYRRD